MGQTWKKAIWKRNFLFWGKYALQMVETLIGFTVGYGILFSLTGDGAFFSSGFFYAVLIGMIFAWMEPFAYTGAYLPLVLSFGSGRREAVLGAQIQHFLSDVLMYLVILSASVLSGHPQGALVYVAIAIGLFFLTGFGQYLLILQIRFGVKGIVISVIVTVGGLIVGIAAGLGYLEQITAWVQGINSTTLWMAALAGAMISLILYLISVRILLHIVRTYEVKA